MGAVTKSLTTQQEITTGHNRPGRVNPLILLGADLEPLYLDLLQEISAVI